MKVKLWFFLANIIPVKLYLRILFYLKQTSFLHIKKPETFNEKMQYLKIWGYKDFHTVVADKYLVREYIKNKIGEKYLIPLFHVTSVPSQKDFEKLPRTFVMKANHGSSMVKIIHDINKENIADLISICSSWLKENHYQITKEPQYKNIKRKIIFEKFLEGVNGSLPMDYKFHCFEDKVEIIQIDIDRFTNHRRILYDKAWERMPFHWSTWKNGKEKSPQGGDIAKPKNLDEMITIVELLARDFNYARIDLYNLDGVIYFGEITLHPGSGWERITPQKFDKILGSKIKLM
jgi:hypothetical protein